MFNLPFGEVYLLTFPSVSLCVANCLSYPPKIVLISFSNVSLGSMDFLCVYVLTSGFYFYFFEFLIEG